MVRGDADPEDDLPRKLGPFLNTLLEKKPDLHIHLLTWDFSMIYAAEREWRLFSDSLRNPHPRLHLCYDNQLPDSASHHQKVVVIDDQLAYAGGLDLSVWRWDTAEHRFDDERRTDPSGKPYNPFHDIQIAVTGPAARALGDLCAERWHRATGDTLERGGTGDHQIPWPDFLDPVFEDVKIGFSRTMAEFESQPRVLEIEHLHLDVIAAAESYLYFQNQYFSSRRIADALAGRLREEDGPEVVIVLTQTTDGWLEKSTMGLRRDRLLEQLSEADTHDRLRIYYPVVTDDSGDSVEVYVHSKVFIVDDRIAKVGSSNLSNRSMRLDTELDLTIAFPDTAAGIRSWLHGLLAIHFATAPESIAERIAGEGSLRAGLDSLISSSGHSLRSLQYGIHSDLVRRFAESQWLDPDEPIDPDYWIRSFVPKEERPSVWRRVVVAGTLLSLGLGLVFIVNRGWGEVIDREAIETWFRSIQSEPWTPVVLTGAFLAAGLVGVPLNLLLIVATAVMGPWVAFGCGYLGSHLSAVAGFGAGHVFGKPLLSKIDSKQVRRFNEQLKERALLPVVLVRIIPVAPFVVVNLAAGASRLRFGMFNLGTVLGMAPGMAMVVLLTHEVGSVLTDPSAGAIALLVALFGLAAGGIYLLRRALTSRSKSH